MSAPRTTPFDIFRVGTHVAMSGDRLAFGESDLDAMVAAYDPALHQAPIVVGHPASDAPAYGWVAALVRDGERLLAAPEQIDPAFAELVRAGRFKKVSASFYAPDAEVNPRPGAYYLRHVGFLGAQPPAVKGLREARFADAEAGVVTLELGEWSDLESASLWRRLREFFIAQFGLDQADRVIPSFAVESLEVEARAPAPTAQAAQPVYSEPSMPDPATPAAAAAPDPSTLDAALQARQADLEARETRLRAAEDAARRARHAEFAESLVTRGQLLPADRDGLTALMASLPNVAIAFGEGDGAFCGAPEAWLRAFLQRMPVQVDYSERTPAGAAAPAVHFSAPPETRVDPERLALHARALAFQEAHPGTPYADAVLTVSQGV